MNYGTLQPGGTQPTALGPGESTKLFDAESPAAPQASIAIARGFGPSDSNAGLTFSIDYAAAPTAVMLIQASNTDLDADYVTIYTSTDLQHDIWTDQSRAAFYRAKLNSQSAGGAVTVKVQR